MSIVREDPSPEDITGVTRVQLLRLKDHFQALTDVLERRAEAGDEPQASNGRNFLDGLEVLYQLCGKTGLIDSSDSFHTSITGFIGSINLVPLLSASDELDGRVPALHEPVRLITEFAETLRRTKGVDDGTEMVLASVIIHTVSTFFLNAVLTAEFMHDADDSDFDSVVSYHLFGNDLARSLQNISDTLLRPLVKNMPMGEMPESLREILDDVREEGGDGRISDDETLQLGATLQFAELDSDTDVSPHMIFADLIAEGLTLRRNNDWTENS